MFVIFWDEYHIGRFAEAIQGRSALTTFVSTAFGAADLVALMDPLLPVDALRFTRDRRELAEKIAKLEGRFGIYMPTRSAAEDNMLERRDIARVRSEVTISALRVRRGPPRQHQGRAQVDHLRQRRADRARHGSALA